MLSLRTAALATRHFGEAASRVWRILRALFQEVIGFTFLVFAGWGTLWLVRSFRNLTGDGEGLFKLAMVAIFVLMMGSFGISSFRRARKISRAK